MGGFHLRGMSRRQIDEIVQGFKKEGVKRVGPCHCSGSLARKLFKKAYDKDFIPDLLSILEFRKIKECLNVSEEERRFVIE